MELDEEQWHELMNLLDDYPRIKAVVVAYEHRIWLIGFIRSLAKWITAVAAAVVIAQQIWAQIITWIVHK